MKIVLFALLMIMFGCKAQKGEQEYKSAKKILSSEPQKAVIEFERVLKVYPQTDYAMKSAIDMLEFCPTTKVCQEAEIIFLNYIIKYNTDTEITIRAHKRLCDVLFERGYFQQAIDVINALLSRTSENLFLEHRLQLAKSYYYLKNFYQAEVELNRYIQYMEQEEKRVEGLALKAEILSAQKKYQEAVQAFKEIKTQFKEIYLKNQVYLNEALMFEEQKQLDLAIQTLEEVVSEIKSPEFVEMKIQKLKENRALMPGASGLKK